jgi:putative flippase GtrA
MIERSIQLARFCAVGLLCFLVSLALLAALCELGHINYLPAFAVTFVLSGVLGYRLNGRYTFSRGRRFDHAAMSRYLMVNGVLFALNSIVLRLLVENLHIWYITATVVLAAVNLPASFIAHQLVSYRIAGPSTELDKRTSNGM